MIVLVPGFQQPTQIYEMKQLKSGKLKLKLKETDSGATMQDLMDEHLDNRQTILIDSGYPEQQSVMQRIGFHVIAGRL